MKPRSIATVFITTVVIFLLVTGITLVAFAGFTLAQTGTLQDKTQEAVFESIRSELQTSYANLAPLLDSRQRDFREVHAEALEMIGDEAEEIELEALQEDLIDRIRIPVDIYIINPDKKVIATTYPPDEDLDFSLPALFDGRTMIERAHERDDIVVSAPVLEVAAREFRVYTYSPLGDTDYTFELGFISPALNQYFNNMERQLSERDLFEVQLHFLMWDDWLLSLHPDRRDTEDKQELLEQHHEFQQETLSRFRQARDEGEPVRVKNDEAYRYYLHVMDIPGEEWDMNVMAKVDLTTDIGATTREAIVTASLIMLVLLSLAVLTAFLFLRQTVARPLADAAHAMETWRPFRLRGGGHLIRELQLLASHYNSMLDGARSRIRGLGREARTDSLTQIANRGRLESELEVELRRNERYGTDFSLIFMDVDHFKQVNDRFGHLVGDRALRDLAKLLQERVRAADTVGRWGGEEFLILCRNTRLADAAALAEDLRNAIVDLEILDAEQCTASFGVATIREGDTVESLFTRADEALYRAKKNGRNRVEYELDAGRD